MELKKYLLGLTFLIACLGVVPVQAALPENISELVETSAPAVVNITSKKEVSMRSRENLSMNLSVVLVSQEPFHKFLNNHKPERQFRMDLVLYLKINTY